MNDKEHSDFEKNLLRDAQRAIGEAIKSSLTGFNSSFNKLVNSVIESHSAELREIINENFTSVIKSDDFSQAIKHAFEHKLAKILVSKLEGSVEKCVNTLRSDPTIRARMVLAIESIIAESRE